MKSLLSIALVVITLLALATSNVGCKAKESHEFRPGEGWVPI